MGLEKYIEGKELFAGHYRLIKLLSEDGGSADVWLAEIDESVDTTFSEEKDDIVRLEGTGVLVAIKIYRPKNILDVEGEQSFRQEFKTIFNCHHANLLPTTAYSVCDGMPYLVMPFCKNGSVEKLLGHLTKPNDIWKFIYDTASGLEYLHSCTPQIIHQDIKPANILIDDNKNYCISDFGISVKFGIKDDNYYDNLTSGTSQYMAPERFADNYTPSSSSDIWSLGITICELILGKYPRIDGASYIQQLRKKKVPSDIVNLIKRCLSYEPTRRPSAYDIVELSRSKVNKRIPSQRYIGVLVLMAFCFGTLFFVQKKKETTNNSQKKDFLEYFAENIWVCDHPEVPVWEEWNVPMSGIVIYSYEYYHLKQKVVCNIKAVPIYSPQDSTLLMQCDSLPSVAGKITNYDKYGFTWKTEVGPFTYNRVIGNLSGTVNEVIEINTSTYLPEDVISYKVHDTSIGMMQNNSKIRLLQEGRTYIDIVTANGTALIRIDCKK